MLRLCSCLLLVVCAMYLHAEDETLLKSCDDLNGFQVTCDGAKLPDTRFEVNADPRFVSEGKGSIHLSSRAPADLKAKLYVGVTFPVPETDFSALGLSLAWLGTSDAKPAAVVASSEEGDLVCLKLP